MIFSSNIRERDLQTVVFHMSNLQSQPIQIKMLPASDMRSVHTCTYNRVRHTCCQRAARSLSWYLRVWSPRADQRSKHESYGQKSKCMPIDSVRHGTAACGSPVYGSQTCFTAANLKQDFVPPSCRVHHALVHVCHTDDASTRLMRPHTCCLDDCSTSASQLGNQSPTY